MATTRGTDGRPVICSCGWPIDGEFQHGTPCTPDCEAPVVVGDVWEGVLEYRTVRVKCWTDLLVWFADEGSRWHACVPLAEFRERFTRRGK